MFKTLLATLILSLFVFTACVPENRTKPEEGPEKSEELEKEEEEIKDEEKEPTQAELDRSLIKSYYDKIAAGDLQEAFDMKIGQAESFNTFSGWYKNTKEAVAYGFEELEPSKYEFNVDLVEANGAQERYRTIMQIEDGKLRTVSAYQISTTMTEASYGDMSAQVQKDSNSEVVYLNGKEIDRINKNADDLEQYFSFGDIQFHQNGTILSVRKIMWEGARVTLYDTSTNKTLHTTTGGIYNYGFTADGKHYYECNGSGLHAGQFNVYYANSFNLKSDVQAKTGQAIAECVGYDAQTNSMNYRVWPLNSNWTYEEIIDNIYYFGTDEVVSGV